MKLTKPQAVRFWSKVSRIEAPEDCALWLGGFRRGYGRFKLNGEDLVASRVAWELTHGPIPDGLHVLHYCDVRGCMAHLWTGTNADNMADRHAKGRDAKGDSNGARRHPERMARGDANGARLHPERLARGDQNGSRLHPQSRPRGDAHPNATVREVDIAGIRTRIAAGGSDTEIGRAFGVSRAAIWKIRHRKNWSHVGAEKEIDNAGA